ncbi:CNNM domain-containing protein [Fodinibius halophilus]|uniref:HlyC/CorC family transporter n=1 Tax=Fodinibius halophilus TaxID=1736908 RepID=A0A6M1T8Q9_9BACT|nr:hemolysin family protein [Fodinibius halophilus]NGP89815.1 HlyC/CorC family transporter [Fodinibius halophilus]
MYLLIFYLSLAIGVSFLCSLLEATLLSVSHSYIAIMERKGVRTGKLLRRYKEDIDRPLSAILSLNTIAHTVGAAGVGAQAQIVFGDAYVAISSAVLTFLILVLSEIIPKTIGATYWRNLAPFAARTLRILMVSLYPFVVMSQAITRWLSDDNNLPSFSREEFGALADLGVEEGVFEEEESRIFKNLIRFNSLRVKDIMTPRTVVVGFEEDLEVGDVSENVEQLHFSRLPVYGKERDEITGYVLKNDLLLMMARGETDQQLKELKRDILIVPEMMPLQDFFERLMTKQEHIAIVVDEYGGFAGVVTMEDLVETLLGMEIIDEVDNIEDMQKMARKKWMERAKRLGIVPEDDGETRSLDSPPKAS